MIRSPLTSRPPGGRRAAIALAVAALLFAAGAAPAQRDPGSDTGGGLGNSGGGSLESTGQTGGRFGSDAFGGSLGGDTDRDRDRGRGREREERRRRRTNESTGREPAGAEASAGISEEGAVPTGARPRGVDGRGRGSTITGEPVRPPESRAPGTTIVFNYKMNNPVPVLYFAPADAVLIEGETVETELKCYNPTSEKASRLHLGLRYNPFTLRLTKVDPKPLMPFLRGEPLITFDPEEALLTIEADFAQPVMFAGTTLLVLEWEALAPAPFQQIELVDFAPAGRDRERTTGLYNSTRNIVGSPRISGDGVVPFGIEILADPAKAPVTRAATLDAQIRMASDPVLFGRGGRGGVALELATESRELAVGEEATVRVMFYNPRLSELDSVRLIILFDPDIFEVLDTDGGNAIKTGVNIREGERRQFPFDYYVENRVENRRGMITYRMGLSGDAVFPAEGVLASFRVRARAAAAESSILFGVARGEGWAATRGTEVTFLGHDVLGDAEEPADGLVGLPLSIR